MQKWWRLYIAQKSPRSGHLLRGGIAYLPTPQLANQEALPRRRDSGVLSQLTSSSTAAGTLPQFKTGPRPRPMK